MAVITPVTMPKFGLAMTEGLVAGWLVDPGSPVATGDELVDIETTKIANAYEAPAAGVLRRQVAPAGVTLPVGALIGIIADAAVSEAEIDAFIDRFQADFAATGGAAAAEAPPEPRHVDAGGRRLRVLRHGPAATADQPAATPVVLVHGFGGDLDNWLFLQPLLADRRPVYALDLPGHGGSDKAVSDGSLIELSQAVVALLDALDIDRAHLVGHSLGGAVGLDLASRHPGRVASATLLAPAGLGPDIDGDFISGFITADRRKALQPVLGRLFHDQAAVSRDMVEGVLKFKRLDGAGAALQAVARANFPDGRQANDLRDRLPALRVPVQVVWGEHDRIVPRHHAEALPPAIPSHILAATGHMAHLEQPAATHRLITAFIDQAEA